MIVKDLGNTPHTHTHMRARVNDDEFLTFLFEYVEVDLTLDAIALIRPISDTWST